MPQTINQNCSTPQMNNQIAIDPETLDNTLGIEEKNLSENETTISGNSPNTLKSPMMTDEDISIMVKTLTHYTALCMPEAINNFIEIIRLLEIKKVLTYENIPIVRMALTKVKERYLDSILAAIKNNMDKEKICPIYRNKVNDINSVLSKL